MKGAVGALPATVKTVRARADSGFYCWEAVEAYEKLNCEFILVARKTARLVERLKTEEWKAPPNTDAGGKCEFFYQPVGWSKAYRFLALRYDKEPETSTAEQPEQYQLFETAGYTYRVFVTDMAAPLDTLVWFYRLWGGAENLIKEANNDAGLAAHPSNNWSMNAIHFQIAMLAYNLNCWLLRHSTLAASRLRYLFLAAKIWRHAGRVGVSFSDHYEEKDVFQRLTERLRAVAAGDGGFAPCCIENPARSPARIKFYAPAAVARAGERAGLMVGSRYCVHHSGSIAAIGEVRGRSLSRCRGIGGRRRRSGRGCHRPTTQEAFASADRQAPGQLHQG